MHLKQNFNIVFCSGLFYNRVSRACKSYEYNKNWNRIGSAGLYDCNTFLPFRAGCVRMTEADGSQISPVYTMNGMLSDCESVYISDTVVWYTSDSDGNVTF